MIYQFKYYESMGQFNAEQTARSANGWTVKDFRLIEGVGTVKWAVAVLWQKPRTAEDYK